MIFVSYAWKDWNIVQPLINHLKEKYGEEVYFLDRKNVSLGCNILEKISLSLKETQIFIPFFTPNYLNSKICRMETHAFFFLTLKRPTRILFPYYEKKKTLGEILNSKLLIYASIQGVFGDHNGTDKLIKEIDNFKSGKTVIEFQDFLKSKFVATEKTIHGLILSFISYKRSFSNPLITVELNKKLDWKKFFSSQELIGPLLRVYWDNFDSIQPHYWKQNLKNPNEFVQRLVGTYFLGTKTVLQIFFAFDSKPTDPGKKFLDKYVYYIIKNKEMQRIPLFSKITISKHYFKKQKIAITENYAYVKQEIASWEYASKN